MRFLHLIRDLKLFIFSLYKSKYIIYQLVKRDFQNKYLGSFVGFIWVFIQPAVYISVLWFVLAFGLKPGNLGNANTPYHWWLIAGLIPWMFMSELLSAGTNSIIEYSYLIKKVVFRSSIIPLIKILTSLIIQLFFVVLLALIFIVSKINPTLHWLQVFYYLFSAVMLLLGSLWLSSSLAVFIKDVSQVVNVIVQVLFWVTPIIWYYKTFPESIKPLYFYNPLFYIIQGYRDSFLNQVWFWEHPHETIFFWSFTLVIFIIGAIVFRKLNPHFADVL
jgi:ABC-type polysaccharide/polyol phosphate export permease